MIVRVFHDGSEGFEYEAGDEVEITNVIGGSEFRRAIGRVGPIVKVGHYDRNRPSHHTAILEVQDTPDYGPSRCYPWMLKPAGDTYAKAQRVEVEQVQP